MNLAGYKDVFEIKTEARVHPSPDKLTLPPYTDTLYKERFTLGMTAVHY